MSNSHLVLLDLSFNRISLLPPGAFDGLGNLDELLLNKNRLAQLPGRIFRDTKKLRRLALEENRLKELPNGIFENLTSLKELNMRNIKYAIDGGAQRIVRDPVTTGNSRIIKQ